MHYILLICVNRFSRFPLVRRFHVFTFLLVNLINAFMPQAQPRPMPNVDVFGPTQRITEPVTAGLDIGPGPGPMIPPQQSVNDLLYQMYAMTGDTALLQLVDFD